MFRHSGCMFSNDRDVSLSSYRFVLSNIINAIVWRAFSYSWSMIDYGELMFILRLSYMGSEG